MAHQYVAAMVMECDLRGVGDKRLKRPYRLLGLLGQLDA
jgi:hypothetical protein